MANQKHTKQGRHQWTKAELESLRQEIAQRPASSRVADVLAKYGITDSAYRSTLRRMQARDAKEAAKPRKTLPPAVPVAALEPTEDFRNATIDRKQIMLAEHDALFKEQKPAWRKAHNTSQALLAHYRNKVFKSGKRATPKIGHPPAKFQLEDLPALVKEYYALPHIGGNKGEWLKAHGLNHQNMFDYRKRVRRMNLNGTANGTSNLPAVRQETHHRQTVRAAIGRSIGRPPQRPPQPPPQPPVIPTPTLQDGVNYLEIKRDLFNEIIADLNRVLKGGR